MKKRNLFITALILLVMSSGVALASPVELYLVKFAPGTDIYRLAGAQNWPVYHIFGNQALIGKQLFQSDYKAVLEATQTYHGPSENLRWVHIKRNSPMPAIKAIYSAKDMLLVKYGNVTAAGVKSGRDYMIKSFNPQPIVISNTAAIKSSSLARDTMVATLTYLVDTAQVRTRIEALQSFNTRFLDAANHDSVVGWIKNQFLGMGITDVITDTFDVGYGLQQHNIIATIPGFLDTSVVYIVGGHYDSYSSALYTQAPGADDNASGTVAAMEMARVLSMPGNRPNYTVQFIAFDAEELGLYGSEYYAQKALSDGRNIGCMLNYDMIGYKGNDSTFVSKLYSGSEDYAYLLGQMASWYGRLADTNLVPEYNSVYLQGSDSWEFYIRGYPATYSEELEFSSVYHTTRDSTTYMNMRYCTSIIKAGIGLLGTLANYPQKVNGLTIADVGNGSQLFIQWQPNNASNIINYKIGWGLSSGNYDHFSTINDTSFTINSLLTDSLYYIGVIAIDDQNCESPIISEIYGTPKAIPLVPFIVSATPITFGTTVLWQANAELDIAGYNIYRKVNDGTYDSLASTLDTTYVDSLLSGANRYYYKVRAYDNDGNYGQLSDSVYSRPITLDQGVLVVDETNNWTLTIYPNDAKQDSFYNYILADYKHEQYEYGTSLQKPILADFGPYSTVAWFADDYTTLLASGAVEDLKVYLDNGGKLWFTGWKSTGDIRNDANSYPADFASGSFIYDYMKVSHASLSAGIDSFQAATGLLSYPSISVDPLKVPISSWLGTMRYIESLAPVAPGEGIYLIDMKNDTSPYEGQVCAVRDSGKTVLFGFPLYFMDKEQAKLAAQQVITEFGEPSGVTTERPRDNDQLPVFKLYQNTPNPFNSRTTISYQLPKAGKVKLNVYNISGQLVKTLVNQEQPAGSYAIKWDGRDNQNKQVSAGVYIYQLSTSDKTQSRKMIVLK